MTPTFGPWTHSQRMISILTRWRASVAITQKTESCSRIAGAKRRDRCIVVRIAHLARSSRSQAGRPST